MIVVELSRTSCAKLAPRIDPTQPNFVGGLARLSALRPHAELHYLAKGRQRSEKPRRLALAAAFSGLAAITKANANECAIPLASGLRRERVREPKGATARQ